MTSEKATLSQLIRRVDIMMAELTALREELRTMLLQPPQKSSMTDTLYGALGQGAPDEYDSVTEWERFA